MELSFLFKDSEADQACAAQVRSDSFNFRLSPKFRVYYRFLRPIMPIALRQMLQRKQIVELEDRWYEPIEFMQSLAECLKSSETDSIVHPWPNGSEFAFVLTHDVETSEGLRHIPRIADMEESLGFRSSWNLIPSKYKIDMGLVKDLKSRGFEIGIHGYNHDGQLYSSEKVFMRRAPRINQAMMKYGAVGFRSPMVHRNLKWLQALDVEYDGSCFDVDPFQAAPGGVGTIWPFIVGRFVELPYTLPQDHTLFIGLGHRDDRIWKEKLQYIADHQGMALMLTHPDYLVSRSDAGIYYGFLQYVKHQGRYWHALPRETARWWRDREQVVEFGLSDLLNGNRSTISTLKHHAQGFEFVSC